MKWLYFIRHGESELNAINTHQSADVKLSIKGQHQAKVLAERCAKLPLELILSSDFDRTRETAEILRDKIQKELVTTDLLREVKKPTEIEGMLADSPEAVSIKQSIKEHINDLDWHHSDEENFKDVLSRAKAFIDFTLQRNEEHILVVSHGAFIKTVMAQLLLADNLTPSIMEDIKHFFRYKNTGISILQYNDDQTWMLITWNDHAHLG